MADLVVQSEQPQPDNARASIRGRACPRCGGKIIPSNRAVYESKEDPASVYPLWTCERCGHEELVERAPAEKKPAHGPAKKGAE